MDMLGGCLTMLEANLVDMVIMYSPRERAGLAFEVAFAVALGAKVWGLCSCPGLH